MHGAGAGVQRAVSGGALVLGAGSGCPGVPGTAPGLELLVPFPRFGRRFRRRCHVSRHVSGMGQRDRMFKVLVVGDATVGKTSLVQRYANDSFNRHYKSTVGGERVRYRGAGALVLPLSRYRGCGRVCKASAAVCPPVQSSCSSKHPIAVALMTAKLLH